MKPVAPVLALLVASVALAGCFGGAKEDVKPTETLKPREITQDTERRFQELTQVIPSNYTFPGQEALEPVVLWLNDTIDATANTAVESPGDDGGMNFGTFVRTQDFSQYIPPNQAVEVHVKLFWYGNPGQSADLDIYFDLPGVRGAYDPSLGQEFNYNIPVKRAVVNTVGVAGMEHLIGVQATNGRMAPGQSVPFFMQISFDYAKDVLTPYHPYAFTVPDGATGVVLRSAKVAGDEHVRSDFVILSPQDEVVSFTRFDDIAIPTESVFIPLRGAGEYVFYAYEMHGGFLSLKADSPVPQRATRILGLVEEEAVDFTGPAAPGLAEHNLSVANTPYTEGTSVSFTVERGHPLRIDCWFAEGQSVSVDAQVKIIGPKGEVCSAVRSARADLGDQGSLGWTGDHPPFVLHDYSLLGKGAYQASIVANGYTGQIGHTILFYERGTPGGS